MFQVKQFSEYLSEGRKAGITYKAKAKKGPKLAEPEDKVTRIEALVSNKDMPGNLGSMFGSFAAAYKKVAEAAKEFDELKKTNRGIILDYADDIFDASDALVTRVIETAGYAISISKAEQRATFDKEVFMKLLKANLKDSNKLIDQLYAKSFKVVNVSSAISVEDKSIDEADESVVTKIGITLKAAWASLKAIFIKTLSDIDDRNAKLAAML